MGRSPIFELKKFGSSYKVLSTLCKITSFVFPDFWQNDRVQGTLKCGFSWKFFPLLPFSCYQLFFLVYVYSSCSLHFLTLWYFFYFYVTHQPKLPALNFTFRLHRLSWFFRYCRISRIIREIWSQLRKIISNHDPYKYQDLSNKNVFTPHTILYFLILISMVMPVKKSSRKKYDLAEILHRPFFILSLN